MKFIVYTSKTGHTAQYAELLAKKTGMKACSLNEARTQVPAGEEILYMGWLMAGMVKGYKKALKRYSVKAVCGVGMSKYSTQTAEIRKGNAIPPEVPVFSLQGGLEIEKLHGASRWMMSIMRKSVLKGLSEKQDKTEDEIVMLDLMQNGGNRVEEEQLEEILDWLTKTEE